MKRPISIKKRRWNERIAMKFLINNSNIQKLPYFIGLDMNEFEIMIYAYYFQLLFGNLSCIFPFLECIGFDLIGAEFFVEQIDNVDEEKKRENTI